MKLGRILGVILSIGIIGFAVAYGKVDSKENNGPVELASSNGVISEEGVEFGNVVLDMDNNQNVNVVKYTNTNSYPVELGTSSIDIICTGTGENKAEDEFIVSKNMKVKAAFAESENGTKYDSILVKKHETIYIFIASEYAGEEYPLNEVNCNYNVNIQSQ